MAAISDINPMGTDGFEFVEYAAPDAEALASRFLALERFVWFRNQEGFPNSRDRDSR